MANLRFHFSSSFIASLGSAVASTPIDVIRVGDMKQEQSITKYYNLFLDPLDEPEARDHGERQWNGYSEIL